MNQSDYVITHEELLRINYFAKTANQSKVQRPKKAVYNETYSFKPQINKKSLGLQRNVDDLYRWQERKEQKISQQFENEVCKCLKKCQEIFQSANRLTHSMDENQINVFDRLYVVRRTSDNQSTNDIHQVNTKRNTSDTYFAKNTPSDKKVPAEESSVTMQFEQESPARSSYKPCLPNRFFFEQKKEDLLQPDPELKITTPQHMFLDIKDEIQLVNNSPEPAPIKKPLHQKDIDTMVEKLNSWNQKKQYKILEQQKSKLENEQSECTFKPQLSKSPRQQGQYQPSLQSHQIQSQSYTNMFQNKSAKYY